MPKRRKGSDAPDATHLDKIFWPGEGITKGDVLAYYERMAPVILPHVRGRPENLRRHPNGIRGTSFYQQDTSELALPRFVHVARIRAETTGETLRHIVCDNRETLRYLANLGCIELNPWLSRVGSLARPDYLVFDLDPSRGNSFEDVVRVAQALRALLDELALPSRPKTSGKRGIHVAVPLSARYTYARSRAFARAVAERLAGEHPALATVAPRKSARGRRVYLDTSRNARGQTLAACYALRSVPGAPVSCPLAWHEVRRGLDQGAFTIKTMPRRIKRVGDLWRGTLGRGADLARAAHLLIERAKK